MTAPITSKLWTIAPNVRNLYTTLVDMTAWCLYENKVAMVGVGWTVKFSSDGVTGPANGADTTDRWLARANAGVRAAVAAAAQSWIVLQNVDGVQVLLDFQGASDDIARIAFSPKGLYTLAGTTTHQPTATDEVICSSTATVISATAGGDRVMSIWTSNDTRNWSFIVFRTAAVISFIGVERIVNLCGPGVFGDGVVDIPYVGWRYTNLVRHNSTSFPGTINPTSGLLFGVTGAIARVFTAGTSKTIRIGGGGVLCCYEGNAGGGPTNPFLSTVNVSELNIGVPAMPVLWSSFITAGATGFIGYPIDWWQMVAAGGATPAQSDFVPGYEVGDTPGVDPVRTNWFVALGASVIRPWKNSAPTLEVT
jgi:hypothetical protein